jgi:hypothetical protein
MLNAKRWLILCLLITGSSLLLLTATNYMVDPYGFNKERSKNTNFTTPFKANIVSHNEFNAIMLGTSKTGVMDPNIINQHLGVNAFNLSYPSANTEIQNRFFKYAYHFNPNIKYLIYGIDFGCFNESRHTKKHFVEFYDLEDKIENREKISSFDLYFNFNTFTSSAKQIFEKEKLEAQYLSANGMLDYVNNIKELESGTYDLDKKMQQSIQVFFQKEGIYKDYKFSYQLLNEFKYILKFCEEKNIKVFVYIPPVHSDHFDAIAKAGYFNEFELFKRELVKVTDYIDFTGHNTLSTNKENYWDATHLRKELTETIMTAVLDRSDAEASNDFGKLVTKNNIETHLLTLRGQIQDYDLDKVLSEDFK